MIGKIVKSRYQIVQLLISGVFGQTYIAEDLHQTGNPRCVLKHFNFASPAPNLSSITKRRFICETETLKKLKDNEHIPQLLDYFEENQEFFLVQEFIQGHPLSAELPISKGCVKRWTQSQVVQMLQDILCILDFVHSQGIIYCDIKPNNIIRRSGDGKLFLTDFSAVQSQHFTIDKAQSNTTLAISGLGYIPAEQLIGHPHPNSDIYALGMIAIQALIGVEPAQLTEDPVTGEVIWEHHLPLEAMYESPLNELISVLKKMVRYHFRTRYQSAFETLQALQPLTVEISEPEVLEADCIRMSAGRQEVLSRAVIVEAGLRRLLPFSKVWGGETASIQEVLINTPVENSEGIIRQSSFNPSVENRSYKVPTSPILTGVTIGIAANSLVIAGGIYSLLQAFPSESTSGILVTAQEKYQNGDFKGAIALAKSIPSKSTVYPEAQAAIQEWSKDWHTAATQFKAAEQAFKESRWLDVVVAARKIPDVPFWEKKAEPILQKAQPKIEAEAKQLIQKAYEKASEKDFTSAVNYLKLIPKDTVDVTIQQKLVEYTEKERIKSEYLLQQAYERAAQTNFAGALNYLQQIPQDTPTYAQAQAKIAEYTKKQHIQTEAQKAAMSTAKSSSANKVSSSSNTEAKYQDINPGSRLQEVTIKVRSR
ncbi:serine/threonine protein kinase [Funiculus sociatus GB2-A5]|uniref:non-specific serine/threonine protein kinase n=1 Tax=Funiculus sociatus GB2-A5 TaxID=2933946 RepID=A0ABV0JQ62_9CYAN|nr:MULTISPECIES: serine/threonine-protein kinase [unclassified Trichocoleus]MBD1908773.1 serine/threonine protein kinase [Trichocoleus sp. FACHB-832]MBD2065087.1 serine/threonine protein kinase [Trichocoleus sp. FACHB-6]